MKIGTILPLALLAFSGATFAEEHKDKDHLHDLFTKMEGEWQCEGAFANGKKLAANVSMKTDYDGRILQYRHEDLPPNTFKARGHWSFTASDNNLVVSLHMAGDKGSTIATYIGKSWSDNKLTFKAKALWEPLWAENRFTWEVKAPNQLYMLWEREKDGEWHMGDYLNCVK